MPDSFENRIADFYVNGVYDTERLYGGPEEGGWWYTSYTLVRVSGGGQDESDALAQADSLREKLDDSYAVMTWGLGRTELRSEVSERMDYDWDYVPSHSDYVIRWDVPTYLPEQRPHYS